MKPRRILFWLHLTAGTIAGVVVLLMSVTGVLLMYEKQITAWADRGFRVPAGDVSRRVPIEALLEKAREQRGSLPATIALRSDPAEPAAAGYGREATVYLDPYTGAILGEGSTGVRAFFQSVTAWHRWLGFQDAGPKRVAARVVTGASNFAFLFLVISGAYLWLPRKWSWQHVRAVLLFRGGLAGKARDFNWHNVTGVWCVAPLLIVVASGVVMSYPWASNLVYRLAGSNPPEQGGGRGGQTRGGEARPVDLSGLGDLWAKAEQQMPGWQSISLRVPASSRAPLVFTIDQSNGGQPQKRATLTLDRASGVVRQWETFDSQDRGRQWRSWVRFAHTGEYYGIAGQTIAGLASAGGALLVWTGLSLALRRLRSWRTRRHTVKEEVREPTMVA